MIRAGNFTIEDNGFTVETVSAGGVARRALIAELPGGISDEALAAFCAGPVEVLDEEGNVAQTHTGPFSVLSHGMKLVRTNQESDVAVLSARVASLEAELVVVKNAKENAQSELASLSDQLSALRHGTVTTKDTTGDIAYNTELAAGSVHADSL